MLKTRLMVIAVLAPVGIAAIYLGGIFYYLVIALILGLAAYEYVRLFHAGGFKPSAFLVIGGVLLLVAGRVLNDFESSHWMLALLVLAAMIYHLVAYERGSDQAGTEFAITVAGILYLGWIGGYLISLRKLPDGEWWLFLILPAVWFADSGAYFVGRRWGRRKLSPRLSPKKTWEGFWGGVVSGTLGGALMAAVWQASFVPGSVMTPGRGALLGLTLSVLTVFGDLGESMFKRQVGVKDSSNLLPGHGGVFDRIDSWLWGGVIGFYLVMLFLQMG